MSALPFTGCVVHNIRRQASGCPTCTFVAELEARLEALARDYRMLRDASSPDAKLSFELIRQRDEAVAEAAALRRDGTAADGVDWRERARGLREVMDALLYAGRSRGQAGHIEVDRGVWKRTLDVWRGLGLASPYRCTTHPEASVDLDGETWRCRACSAGVGRIATVRLTPPAEGGAK